MILVDTSVWIELVAGRIRPMRGTDLANVATCPPIVQEVFQGLKPGPASDAFRDSFLALPLLSNPVPLDPYLSAADIYRQGRRRGLTIRSRADCLIASIALHHGVPVWHRDRVFESIARYTALETV
jgi:predicted nucleic acid-binding protein